MDYHSFFFSQVPDALTYLGAALHFYDVTFRYAPAPQAKGKVERLHQFWQNRLPALFAAEAIVDPASANPLDRQPPGPPQPQGNPPRIGPDPAIGMGCGAPVEAFRLTPPAAVSLVELCLEPPRRDQGGRRRNGSGGNAAVSDRNPVRPEPS